MSEQAELDSSFTEADFRCFFDDETSQEFQAFQTPQTPHTPQIALQQMQPMQVIMTSAPPAQKSLPLVVVTPQEVERLKKQAQRAKAKQANSLDLTHPDNSTGGTWVTGKGWDGSHSAGVREAMIRLRNSPQVAKLRADKQHKEDSIWTDIARSLQLVSFTPTI
jgi:hypothetical protein